VQEATIEPVVLSYAGRSVRGVVTSRDWRLTQTMRKALGAQALYYARNAALSYLFLLVALLYLNLYPP